MIIAPSILAADFLHLEQSIELINRSEARWVHCDVMDGMFVPNISFGFPVLEAVSHCSFKPLDVHMMVCDPDRYVGRVRDIGASIMNVHVEACTHLHRTIEQIHQAGMRAAVTLNPATPLISLQEIIGEIDMVLLMSVDPGYGGQSFIANTIGKIERLVDMRKNHDARFLIEVDGGINLETGAKCAQAGADVLVAGSFVFKAPNPYDAISELVKMKSL